MYRAGGNTVIDLLLRAGSHKLVTAPPSRPEALRVALLASAIGFGSNYTVQLHKTLMYRCLKKRVG